MPNQRASLDLGNKSDSIDIAELAGSSRLKKDAVDPETIKQVSEMSGFPSREKTVKTRRRRKKSPFTQQLGLKCRPEMRELFQDMSEYLDVYDHTTFERAMLALIEKEGTEEHLKRYESIVK